MTCGLAFIVGLLVGCLVAAVGGLLYLGMDDPRRNQLR